MTHALRHGKEGRFTNISWRPLERAGSRSAGRWCERSCTIGTGLGLSKVGQRQLGSVKVWPNPNIVETRLSSLLYGSAGGATFQSLGGDSSWRQQSSVVNWVTPHGEELLSPRKSCHGSTKRSWSKKRRNRVPKVVVTYKTLRYESLV